MTQKKQKQESRNSQSGGEDKAHKPMDPVAFSHAMIEAYEKALPLMQDMMTQWSEDIENRPLDPLNVREAYMEFLNQVTENPTHFANLQMGYWQDMMTLWQSSLLKFWGADAGEDNKALVQIDPRDRRFRAPEWQESAVFDFIKQSYLLSCQWMQRTIRETQGLSEDEKRRLEFSAEFLANALSPSNFVMTNPEVLKETLDTGGENLIKGFENLIEDMKRGQGELDISTTRYDAFEVGKNLAITPGKVVFENELMQLIQYTPSTKEVFKRSLLIVPPWINKYYILDLQPKNSFIKWLVEQGHTVFVISWVNPNKKLAQRRFEDYMDEGVLTALNEIEKRTKEPDVNAIGYCLGGTLLTITLSYLAEKGQQDKIKSATFLTTLIDFEKAGDLKLFMDDSQLELLDREMAEEGVLHGKQLQRTFSLLRSNDLIWSFVVNNYLMGKEPFPFDLLYWNDDSTNMPAAMHSFYLRKLYRDNLLIQPGGISMNGTPIDISKIRTPAYFLSTREDHIAPWRATFAGPQHFSGPVTFTLAASGHTAGVVNHPDKNKYCYWTAPEKAATPDGWFKDAKEKEGSWWPHWQTWIKDFTDEKVTARKIGKAIEDAPGRYVKMKV